MNMNRKTAVVLAALAAVPVTVRAQTATAPAPVNTAHQPTSAPQVSPSIPFTWNDITPDKQTAYKEMVKSCNVSDDQTLAALRRINLWSGFYSGTALPNVNDPSNGAFLFPFTKVVSEQITLTSTFNEKNLGEFLAAFDNAKQATLPVDCAYNILQRAVLQEAWDARPTRGQSQQVQPTRDQPKP